MTSSEVAHQLVALCRDGRFVEAVETLYADDIVSVEAIASEGTPREMCGKNAIRGKNVWWFENNEVHGVTITGPFVNPERFAVWYSFDRTNKASGKRDQFSEVAVYTVMNGKVAREEFLYSESQ